MSSTCVPMYQMRPKGSLTPPRWLSRAPRPRPPRRGTRVLAWLGCLRGSRGRWYGAPIERKPEHLCEFRRIRPANKHFRRLVPAGAITQRAGETGDEIAVHRRVRLEVYGLHLEGSLLAVGLGVEPPNEGAVVEYREGVVSVAAADRRGVDLDLVLEVEELESPRPIPDHRIERG